MKAHLGTDRLDLVTVQGARRGKQQGGHQAGKVLTCLVIAAVVKRVEVRPQPRIGGRQPLAPALRDVIEVRGPLRELAPACASARCEVTRSIL